MTANLSQDALRDRAARFAANYQATTSEKQNVFDPACGCGNFLVIAYRKLRLLELDVIATLWGEKLTGHLDVDTLIRCNVDQFHGLEIDDSADIQQQKIASAAQTILDERAAEVSRCHAQQQTCSLADLYAPGNMPADLRKAHAQLDKAVDTAYGYKGKSDDTARVAYLFERYQALKQTKTKVIIQTPTKNYTVSVLPPLKKGGRGGEQREGAYLIKSPLPLFSKEGD